MKTANELITLAKQARLAAYAPYSGYAVGAALLAADGRVFCGCNIENAAFSPSLCAERVAVAKAVSEGARDFVSIAVVGAPVGTEPIGVSPCGVCLQTLQEFCTPQNFYIHMPTESGAVQTYSLAQMLPLAFDKTDAF